MAPGRRLDASPDRRLVNQPINQRDRQQSPATDDQLQTHIPACRQQAAPDDSVQSPSPECQSGEEPGHHRQHAGHFVAQADRELANPDKLVAQTSGARKYEDELEVAQRTAHDSWGSMP